MKHILLWLLLMVQQLAAYAQQGEWTWMKGSAGNAPSAVYGTQGIPASTNTPQGLYEPCEWRDDNGFFWLYGGNDGFEVCSNLWKYDPSTNEWTWVKGPGNSPNEFPVYGTQGVPAPNNTPGARSFCVSTWVDNAGDLWLFGGDNWYFDSFSDLWKYSIGTNEWTWMKGPNTPNQFGHYGTQNTADPANYPGSRRETNATWTDSNNCLWLFGGYGVGEGGITGVLNDVCKYDINANTWTWMRGSKYSNDLGSYGIMGVTDTSNNPPSRMVFTKWKDATDNFWIFGGAADDTWYNYLNDVWKYEPSENKWTWMSGTSTYNNAGTSDTFCVSGINLVPSARLENRACWSDSCGNFWAFGGGLNSAVNNDYNDLWSFNPVTLEWTLIHGSTNSNQVGNYGTQGTSSPYNEPPSRGGSISWIASDGSIWLWGGTDDFYIFYNDLWRYVVDPICSELLVCSSQTTSNFYASETILCEKFCIDYFDSSQNNPNAWQWFFPGGNPSFSTDQNPTNICYDIPGTYDVTLITTNANGSDTLTLSNYITVHPTPPFPIITQVGYTLTSSVGSSYQWQFNSYDIPGATNQSYDVMQTGYYTVIVGDSNSCVNSATQYVLISGMDEVSDGNISIYPNPSSGNFIVEWLNGFVGDKVLLSIFNTLGQEIFSSQEKISTAYWKKEIDLHEVASGVYFIEIKSQNIFLRKKIIVAK